MILCAGAGTRAGGHQDTRISDISHAENIQSRGKYSKMQLLALDLGLRAAAEVVAVADAGVNLGSAQARAHTGDRTFTSGDENH